MTAGQIVLVVAVVAAVGFGLLRARIDGRFGSARHHESAPETVESTPRSVLVDTEFANRLGEKATLVQFSSAFCAPCRVTRRTLGEVAEVVPGVEHIEIDAEAHLDLVRKVGVLRTPTTLILDAHGAEISRAAGAPRKEQVLTALAATLPR